MSSGFELGTAYVHVLPKTTGIGKNLTSALNSEAGSAGTESGAKLGSNLVSSIKKVVAAAGIGMAIKTALDAGGAIQQSFGGLDTLYGEASAAMKQYSQDAASAGISANSYAEQAVSFGASLKSAFGGDVTKAAESANQAIMDMADNSAKMGTDIENVQNAYQGFAKQNYTMLDNLKLGYGGTKSEMERLLADAEKLTGVKYDINNLGDVYSAIHAIQTDLGITGVAAEEAKTTFTGSFSAMKSAAENLLASLTTDELDVAPQMEKLVETANTFLFGNFLPMIARLISTLPEAVGTAFKTAAPLIVENGGEMLDSFISSIGDTLEGAGDTLMEYGGLILDSIIQGLNDGSITSMVNQGIFMISNFCTGILQGLPDILEEGTEVINQLVTGIENNFPRIVNCALTAGTNFILGIVQDLPSIISSGYDIITNLASGILQNLPQILQMGYQAIVNLVSGIKQNFPQIVQSATEGVAKFVATVAQNLPQILSTGIQLIGKLAAGIINGISQIPAACRQVISSAKSAFANYDWKSIGSSIIEGIVSGITGAASSLYNSLKNMASNALSSAKSALDINSPSKKFRDIIGKGIMEGWALGVTSNKNMVLNAVGGVASETYGMDLQSFSIGGQLSSASQMNNRVLELLEIIADKDNSVTIGNREFKRSLEDVGVAFA